MAKLPCTIIITTCKYFMKVTTAPKQWSLFISLFLASYKQAVWQMFHHFPLCLSLYYYLSHSCFSQNRFIKFIVLWSSLSCQSGGASYLIKPTIGLFLPSFHRLTCIHVAGGFLWSTCNITDHCCIIASGLILLRMPNIELSICSTC